MNFKLSSFNGTYRFYTLEYYFEQISKMGFKYCEIWTGPMHFYVNHREYEDIDKLKKLSKKYDISIIAICPEQTNPKPNNIATLDSKLVINVFNYYKNIIDISSKIGANKVIVTSGWGFLDKKREEAYSASIKMMQNICDHALKKEVELSIEALQSGETNLVRSLDELEKYVNCVDRKNLYICLDTGAMNGSGDDIKNYFLRFKNKINHIHLTDGNPTGHLALGDGKCDIFSYLKEIKRNNYSGYITFESVSSKYYMNPVESDMKNLNFFKGLIIWDIS